MSRAQPSRIFTMRIGPLTAPPASYLLRPTTTSNQPAEERGSIDARIVSANIPGALPEGAPGDAISVKTGDDNSNTAVGGFFWSVMTAGFPSDATENAAQANIVSAGYR